MGCTTRLSRITEKTLMMMITAVINQSLLLHAMSSLRHSSALAPVLTVFVSISKIIKMRLSEPFVTVS